MSQRREHRVDPWFLDRAREMRHEQAPAEELLWRMLRNRQLNGFKFRRQYAIEPYVADFYCADGMLIVELDGDSHDTREAHDEMRTKRLVSMGLQVIRFINPDVFENLEDVLETILLACETKGSAKAGPSPLPSPPSTRERGNAI